MNDVDYFGLFWIIAGGLAMTVCGYFWGDQGIYGCNGLKGAILVGGTWLFLFGAIPLIGYIVLWVVNRGDGVD